MQETPQPTLFALVPVRLRFKLQLPVTLARLGTLTTVATYTHIRVKLHTPLMLILYCSVRRKMARSCQDLPLRSVQYPHFPPALPLPPTSVTMLTSMEDRPEGELAARRG
jgi:hypothetical protein